MSTCSGMCREASYMLLVINRTASMIRETILRLQYLCEIIPGKLSGIGDEEFSFKPAPGRWSKKQILGHLIDSASVNHHRFVRGQFEDNPVITYDQDKWCLFNFYQDIDKDTIVALWTAYNRQLLALIKQIPAESLDLKTNNMTIAYLINDYVVHLEHHLRQITDY